MRIAIGADHRGAVLARRLEELLRSEEHQVLALGMPGEQTCDYPDMAYPVAMAVARGQADRGILVCGTGIGMCIAANKIKGVRAATVTDEIGAEFSRRHNDANVLCLSGEMLGDRGAERIVKLWLETDFEAGRHARRLDKIHAMEAGDTPETIDDPFPPDAVADRDSAMVLD